MFDVGKLFELLIEKFEESTVGRIVILGMTITGIAIVIDTMLTKTFPAFTLIAIIFSIGTTATKIYERHKRNKFFEKYEHIYKKDGLH